MAPPTTIPPAGSEPVEPTNPSPIELTAGVPPIERPVCRLILGTGFPREVEPAFADELFDAYVRHGGNCFDTALVYHNAEDVLGAWMQRRGNRAEVVLHAKGAHHEGFRRRVTPPEIRADLDRTLARLGTTWVDLFTLHRDDADQPVGPIIECLAAEQRAGRIRAYGLSNWTIPRLEEARAYAAAQGLPPVAVSSLNLALAFPNEPSWPNCVSACDRHSREWHARAGLPLFAWSSLALGFFGGPYDPPDPLGADPPRALLKDPWHRTVVRVYYSGRNFQRRARATELAVRLGVSPTQVALAWVLRQPMKVFAIVGPRTVQELAELFEALAIPLSPEQLAWLNLERD